MAEPGESRQLAEQIVTEWHAAVHPEEWTWQTVRPSLVERIAAALDTGQRERDDLVMERHHALERERAALARSVAFLQERDDAHASLAVEKGLRIEYATKVGELTTERDRLARELEERGEVVARLADDYWQRARLERGPG